MNGLMSLELEIIDEIILEPTGGAHRDKELILKNVRNSLQKNLNNFDTMSRDEIFDNRKNIKYWLIKGYKHKVFPLFFISFISILISSIASSYPSRSFLVFIYLFSFMLFSYFIF